jgi:hypothetical protein
VLTPKTKLGLDSAWSESKILVESYLKIDVLYDEAKTLKNNLNHVNTTILRFFLARHRRHQRDKEGLEKSPEQGYQGARTLDRHFSLAVHEDSIHQRRHRRGCLATDLGSNL